MYQYTEKKNAKNNLKQPSALSSSPTIQRLVGFEAELSVPVYSRRSGKFLTLAGTPSQDLITFLAGDVRYNQIVEQTDSYILKTDHNELSMKHRDLLIKLSATYSSLYQKNYIDKYFLETPEMIGILEFVTFPADENSDEKVYQTYTHLKAVKEKGKQLIALMNRESLSPLGEVYATGIPIKDLKSWMSGLLGFRSEYSSIASDIEDFKKQTMNSTVNLQATAGILPSSIKKLYESPGLQKTSSLSKIQRIALEDVNSFFNQWKESPYIRSIKNSGDYQSFYGVILLLYTYLLGNTFETIVGNLSSPKNNVPFLCKLTDMHDIIEKSAPLLQGINSDFADIVCRTLQNSSSLISTELFQKITGISDPKAINFRSPRVTVIV